MINSRVPAPGVWLLEHVVDSDRSPCEAYPVLAEAIGGHLVTSGTDGLQTDRENRAVAQTGSCIPIIT